ncbi:MAG: hemolysin family protein [Acidobacteriota bacterium]
MLTELAIAGVALLILVFLSVIESAYESLSEVSLRVMGGEHADTPRSRFFRELLEHRQRFELMLILGTQLSIVAIAILLGDVFTRAGIRAPLIVTFFAVFVIVVLFRQLIPRTIALKRPEETFWALLPIFKIFYRLISIFVAPISNLLVSMRAREPETEDNPEETMHEVQALIDVAEEEGIIEEEEGELIQSIIEFGDTLVAEVMRPRPQIVAIEVDSTVADARRLMIESKYSRLPVYRDHIDEIEGIIYVRDLLAYWEGDSVNTPISVCMRPAYSVPETKSIAELFKEMQKAKIQMAIVIDEYGGVAGLVTIEDIIEEIMGEIEDEDRATAEKQVERAEDGSYLVDGRAEIRKIELLYDKEVEADDFTTVAGLIINELGHVPAAGEKLEYKGLRFEVIDSDGQRVNRVRLRPIEHTRAKH